MNPDDPKWTQRIVLTRIAPMGCKKRYKDIIDMPALIGDLSVHDWWKLILHIMRNEFAPTGFIIFSGRHYHYELVEHTPDNNWILPTQPMFPPPKVKLRWRTLAKKKNKNPARMIVRTDIPTTPSDDSNQS